MKINVTENKVSIKEEQILNENEYNIHKIQFDFSSEYTDDLVKVALFSIDNHTYKKIISNNECDIPPEVLTQRGYSILGVYAYKTEQDTLVLRYSPSPTKISVYDGSYKADAENSEPITPSEIEQYQQILQNSLQQFQNQYNVLVEETEGDIQAIEDELQRKVDEGYFDGEDGYTPQKGVDYFTQEDIEEIEGDILNEVYTKSETDTLLEGKADTTDIPDVSSFITKDVNNLTNYTLKTNTGSLIDLEINDTTYVVTLKLKNQDGTVISTDTIDLPLESVVVSGRYDNTTKKVILTLENGSEVDFSVADLVAGLQTEITSQNKLASDLIDDTNNGNKFVTTSEKQTWNNKYDKPNNGIPKTDLASNVQTSLGKADTAIQSHQDISGKEDETNKVTSIDNTSTDTQYPSAKCVYDSQEEQNTEIGNLQAENERLRNTLPTITGIGQAVTLNKTAELEFVKPPLPMGNSEQVQYSGKNLAGPIQGNITSAGITIQATDNSISINGTATDDSTFQLVGETITRPSKYFQGLVLNEQNSIKISAGTYILSSNEAGLLKFYGNLGDNLGSCTSITSGTAFTITEDKYVWLGIYIGSGVAINKTIDNLQLEQGSTATSFEPYTGGQASPKPDYPQEITNVTGDVEVVVGNKNLAWNGWAEDFVRRINNTLLANIETKDNRNCLKQGASAGWKDYDNKYIFKTNFKENTQYTLIFDLLAERSTQGNIGIEHTDGTIVEPSNLTLNVWNKVVLTSSPNKTIKYIRGVYRDGAEWIDLDTFMVYEGTEQIDFIPRKEQKFIFPLGNEKLMLGDYLADDGIHHVRGQEVYNGSEDWIIRNDTSTNDFLCCRISGYLKDTWKSIFLCSHFEVKKSADSTHNNIRLVNADGYGAQITISRNIAATVNDFKNWLTEQYNNNSPVIVEYELNEEVIVPYTSAQQEVYNQIKQALSYEGQTNISSNQNAIFNVEAYLDTKVILSEKVDKIAGKGLSTNDFTNTYKNSVDSNTSARHTHTNKTVLDGIASSDITNWNGKQNETDNSLNTTNKTITGAINEVYSIARGANQAVSYSNYSTMITAFNALANNVYNVGQNVMIITLNVPDLWISGIESTSQSYTYTTDEAFTTELSTNGYVQVGYYKLSALETQKVDLTDYEQNTNKTTTISSSSTNAQYPSAKAVYDYIQSLDGDEVSY